ncbi:hypothetical protein [Campylobacter concisus]|jgi:hypothetical protein|uniref:Uncharacterized protein n=1 Tax=Campylobacter concisus TaxID=199 RepID=A0A1Y5MK54_9BACT|nr:hypothetical protein [Campylobacter concisus]OUT06855.1 hypothetical protein B9N65_09755 [Campylobacter concisus]OUT08981.1 hypothetical protein B9N65_01170 [Campylobacter concisus]
MKIIIAMLLASALCFAEESMVVRNQLDKVIRLLQDLNDGQNIQIMMLQQILKQQQEINERLKK